MRRLVLWLVCLLMIVALFGPQLAPITSSSTGLVQSIRRVIACDAAAIRRVNTDPAAAANTGCQTGMIRTLEASPTAGLVHDLR